MLVISSFEQSASLEIAIANLEQNGIKQEQILAVPFEKRREQRKLFDNIHQSDGVSLFDLAAALGTAFAVIGASYGFILKWGPIIWGLIGLAVGASIGMTIDYFYTKHTTKNRKKSPKIFTEVVLIVDCENKLGEEVEEILWANQALGVSRINNDNDSSQNSFK